MSFTVSDIKNVQYSGDITIDSLLDSGVNWNFLMPARNILYYTFDLTNFADGKINSAVNAFNSAQQAAADAILTYASSITGITFKLATGNTTADFYFATADLPGSSTSGLCDSGYSYEYSANNVVTKYDASAYIYLDDVQWKKENSNPAANTQGYETLLHEVGHALGLKHPFDGSKTLPTSQDNTNNTVMSYTEKGDYKTTFQSYDLAALKWIYGTDGLGGENHISGSTTTTTPTITNQNLKGTSAANKLQGGTGNDTLDGGTGRDTLIGGDGDDLYIVDNTGDRVIETNTIGLDEIQSSVTFTLSQNVENLTLTGEKAINGTGNVLANNLIGNGKSNILIGNAGNDTLEGGKGNDKLTGGTGNDTFVFQFQDYDFMGDFAPRAVNVDTIADFKKNTDIIQLSSDFTENGFVAVSNIKRTTTDAGLIYDATTRTLYFDADGSGTHYLPTAFIKFTGKMSLDVNDFDVV